MPGAGARLLAELARAGVSPAEVDLVVHTHLHVDHVGWDGSFPNARYVVAADDWSYFMSEESLEARPHLRDRVEPRRADCPDARPHAWSRQRVHRVTGK
jgi:glyoxylase-like metal-dependent hydrolase (beta-lactamase superfamily II)